MKKTLATLLASLMLIMSFTTIVSAAEPDISATTAKISITNNMTTTGIDLTGKQFSVYRVFDATISADGSTINYVLDPAFEQFFRTKLNMPTEDFAVLEAAAEEYIHNAKENDEMGQLVKDLNDDISTQGTASTTTIEGVVSGSNTNQAMASEALLPGYYLVLDTSTNDSTMSAGMLVSLPTKDTENKFTGNANIALKGSQPGIDKDIWHNDLNTTGDWDSVADYEIGDEVKFKITAQIPQNISHYDTYEYIITDTMSKGITFDKSTLKIYLDENLTQEVEGHHHHPTFFENDKDGRIFEITFDMKAIKEKLPNQKEFYIVYSGILNEDAKVAFDSEKNKVELDFSNNPYDKESFGHDEDTVYSYTFAMDIIKTDSTSVNPLANAVFKLIAEPTAENATEREIYLQKGEGNVYYVTQEGTIDEATYDGLIVTDATGKFTIKGLDDKTPYIIREVKAPDGYTKADDLLFEITANYTGSALTEVITDNETKITVTDGVLSTTIINTSSELFPGTGGMGTTIFIIGGSVMLVVAGILLFTSRKKTCEDK